MNDLKKHRHLLILLAVLMVVKFVLVPIVEWQDGVISDIKFQEKKLMKVTKVLNNESNVNVVMAQLNEQLLSAKQLIHTHVPEAKFKLTQQLNFEELLAKYNLTIINIGWNSNSLIKELDVTRFQMNIRFNGNMIDIIHFYTEIEGQKPWIEIDALNLNHRSLAIGTLGFVKGGMISVNHYMYNNLTEQSDSIIPTESMG